MTLAFGDASFPDSTFSTIVVYRMDFFHRFHHRNNFVFRYYVIPDSVVVKVGGTTRNKEMFVRV